MTIAQRITAFPELTAPADEDVLVIVDDPNGPGKKTKKVTVSNLVRESADVRKHGAVGDNSTDDTAAIQAAVNTAGDRGTVFFDPDGKYRITSTITVPYDDHVWQMDSAIIHVDFDGLGVLFGETGVRHFSINPDGGQIVRDGADGGGADYTSGNIGVQFLNVSRSSYTNYDIVGFEKGLFLKADSGEGTTYHRSSPNSIVNCKYAVYIESDGVGSFVNENSFLGSSSISYSGNSPDASGAYAVYIDAINSGAVPNNNKFFGTSFEEGTITAGNHDGAIFNNGEFNQFYGCRYEGWDNPFIDGGAATLNAVYAYGVGLTGTSNINTANHGWDFVLNTGRLDFRGGGDGTNPIITTREFNSDSNVAIRVEGTAGATGFEVGSDGGCTIGVAGSEIAKVVTATATWDPPDIATGLNTSTTIAINAALADSDIAIASHSEAIPAGAHMAAHITANNVATVTLFNETGGNLDLASGTLRVTVIQH